MLLPYEWLYARVCADLIRDLRQGLFEHLQTLPLAYHSRTPAGDSLARFSGDVVTVENAVTTALPWGLQPLLEVTASSVVLAALNWRLALVALLVWPVALLWPLGCRGARWPPVIARRTRRRQCSRWSRRTSQDSQS